MLRVRYMSVWEVRRVLFDLQNEVRPGTRRWDAAASAFTDLLDGTRSRVERAMSRPPVEPWLGAARRDVWGRPRKGWRPMGGVVRVLTKRWMIAGLVAVAVVLVVLVIVYGGAGGGGGGESGY